MRTKLTLLASVTPLALALVLGAGQARADEGRKHDAAEMCRSYAEKLLRDRGRDVDLDIGDIRRADEDNDKVRLDVELYSRQGRDREAEASCEVNFKGDNRVTSFDEDRFIADWRGRDRDWGRDDSNRGGRRRGGNVAQDASRACEQAAEHQGYDVRDVLGQDPEGRDWIRVKMNLRRHGDRFYATCAYNIDRDDADLARVEPDRG